VKYQKEERKKIVDISQLNSQGTSLFPKAKRTGSTGSNRLFSVQ
jgi:hypothetical protein